MADVCLWCGEPPADDNPLTFISQVNDWYHRENCVAAAHKDWRERFSAARGAPAKPKSTTVRLTPAQVERMEKAGWVPGEMAIGEWLVRQAEGAAAIGRALTQFPEKL